MTTLQKPPPQPPLRQPFCKRAMRFSKEGYQALMDTKRMLEAKLERPISESVAINMILLSDSLL